MKKRMDRAWRWLAVNMGKHARYVSIVGLVITIIMGFGLTNLDFATDQDAYLNKNEQVYKDNVEYQDLFGGQAMLGAIRIEEGTTLEEFLSPKNLKIFQEIEKTLVANDSIEAVATPYNTMVLSDTLIQKAAPTEAQVKQLADGEITAANLPTQALPTTSIAGVSLDTATAAAKADGDTDEAEARDKDFGETATRLLAIPEADRTLDNIEWRKFLLYDNTGAVRESLLPFFPNPQTTQIVTRLKGLSLIHIFIVGYGILAQAIVAFDGALENWVPYSFTGGATSAQDLLSTIAAAILSMSTLVLSVTIVARCV